MKWVNYWFVDNSDSAPAVPEFYMFGALYAAKLMKTPQIAYCPSQREVGFTFNEASASAAVANLWPPKLNAVGTPSGSRTKASYSMRPDFMVSVQYHIVSPSTKFQMPKAKDFKGKTTFCDLITHDDDLKTGHRGGLNRAFIDGSVMWIPISAKSAQATPTTIEKNMLKLVSGDNNAYNAAIDGIFDALDRN